MKRALRAWLPAVALTTALAGIGAGEPPRNVVAALAEQRALALARPTDAGVWNDLGNLLALQGDLDEAEGAYARALELDPASASARFNVALLRQQRGDLPGAAGDFRALLEQDPAHAWAHYQLGSVHELLGQRSEALEHYAEAFTLDPELLFAETNPHIIENRLVTEALLVARRGSRSGPPAPRAYNEAQRITSILTPMPSTKETVPETLPSEEPAALEPEVAPAEGQGRSGSTTASPWGARRGSAAAPGDESTSTRPNSAAATVGRDRVLDSSDLRGGVPNQVQGDADSGLPAAPGTRGVRGRAGATITGPTGRRSLHQPPASDDTTSFGFGLRSTGALEWRIGPVSDHPVPAG